MRRVVAAILIILAVAGMTWFTYQGLATRAQTRKPPTPEFETITVTRGDLIATVSATGTLEAAKTQALTFEIGGRVVALYVEEGTEVQAGQVLARLDDTDLQLQVKQAQANLKAAEAQLAQLLAEPALADVEAAKAALAAAQAAYQDLLAGPDPDELAAAEAAVELARVDLEQAQAAYDLVKHRPDIKLLPQSRQLQIATINYNRALAQLRLQKKPPREGQIAQALANIAQAQANLDRLTRGPDPNQVAAQEAAVERARVALEQAEQALRRTVLRAPISGTVTAVNVDVGQTVGAGQPALVITQLYPLHTTVQVDELDVAQVREGQPVRITVDALPDREFTGVIAYLSPVPTVQGGVVTYEARVELQDEDPALRPGMSLAVDIITARAENVLLVPNRVMRINRATGAFYVEKLVDGVPVRTEVEVGLRNDQFSEIRAGLEEGDIIVIRQLSGKEKLRRGLGLDQ